MRRVRNDSDISSQAVAEKYMYSPGLFDKLKDDINQLRLEEIIKQHNSGRTLSEIADVFGITRQRVHQILKREGKTKVYHKRAKNRKKPRR